MTTIEMAAPGAMDPAEAEIVAEVYQPVEATTSAVHHSLFDRFVHAVRVLPAEVPRFSSSTTTRSSKRHDLNAEYPSSWLGM